MTRRGRTSIGTTRARLGLAGALAVGGLCLVVATVSAGPPADHVSDVWSDRPDRDADVSPSGASGYGPAAPAERSDPRLVAGSAAGNLVALGARVERVKGAWSSLAEYYDREVAPLERVLLRYSRDTALVERVSVALVREANGVDLDPRLLLAVLLVENPWLQPTARSPVGAIGLMQVMPVHRGGWGCGSDLEDIDVNICHGARIFAHYWAGSDGDLDRALLRYNGCVRGTNTPDCHQYPNHVFANAGRASVMRWMDVGALAGSP